MYMHFYNNYIKLNLTNVLHLCMCVHVYVGLFVCYSQCRIFSLKKKNLYFYFLFNFKRVTSKCYKINICFVVSIILGAEKVQLPAF